MLIFKANKIDYSTKLFKYLFIITAAAVLLVYLSGIYIKKIEADINQDIKNNLQQLNKYRYLNQEYNNSSSDISMYQFIEKTVLYSKNILLQSLYIDRKEIIISAETDKEKYIFAFLDKLKKDDIFLKAEIKEIAKNKILNFTIRAEIIRSR